MPRGIPNDKVAARPASPHSPTAAGLCLLGYVERPIDLLLTTDEVTVVPSRFGAAFVYRMHDEGGNHVLCYTTTSAGLPDKGDTRRVLAVVAEHRINLGTPETVITQPRPRPPVSD